MPINALCNTVEAQLIYEGFKYVVKVAKMGPTSYLVVLNNSYVTVEAHRYLVCFFFQTKKMEGREGQCGVQGIIFIVGPYFSSFMARFLVL